MSVFLTQKEIDDYYEKKKKEVSLWLLDYAKNLKRVTAEQRRQIIEEAYNVSFNNVGELNFYVQNLKTVGKKDKQCLYEYLSHIDWLPESVNMGVLDGEIVTRILESPLEKLLGDKEWKSKRE